MAGTPNMTSSAATRPPPILRHSICAITPFRLLASMTRICSRSEEHTSELQSPCNLVCRLLLEKKKKENNRLIAHHQTANAVAGKSFNPPQPPHSLLSMVVYNTITLSVPILVQNCPRVYGDTPS